MTAPEVVRSLAPLWKELSEAEQTRLAWSWVDRSVRELLPAWFERLGQVESARELRAQGRIVDARSAELASRLLDDIVEAVGSAEMDLQAGLFSSISFLRSNVSNPAEACFMLVMTSRHVFGDDRVVKELFGPEN